MSSLIPERRMNKNGVMTTKWVRPVSSGSVPAPIPAPVVGSAGTGQDFNVSRTEVAMLFSRSRLASRKFSIHDFTPGSVQAVEWMIQAADADGFKWRANNVVSGVFEDVRENLSAPAFMDETGTLAPFNNLAVFGEAVIQPDGKNFDVTALVLGLRWFDGVKDYLLDASDEQRSQATALLIVASRIEPPFIEATAKMDISLRSDELAAFIMERPDEAADIAYVINERGTDDVAVIREMLDHGQQSLRDGLL